MKMRFRLLLLQTLAAFLFCQAGSIDIKVEEYTNSVKLSCPGGEIRDQNYKTHQSLELLYKDENTGKYDCMKDDSAVSHIFVKFRTCDNCVEFDMTSIVSILVGNLVATTGIGVAVYLVASQTRTSRGPSKKKRSDKQQLVPNDVSDEQYQSLHHRTPDVYDKIRNK
ncbi:T-cell surface glycoprotein CD3 gamma chain [Oryzias latipes]|uniref:CD3 delta subunit of T-cell receptor complex n=1 Tax=Oryzias latipes TaxID=8090 RepID=A0A3B3IIE6_ORYLA|nr:T-cell surface glycoprotein CD3 gamma chain [Oryzias latipes]